MKIIECVPNFSEGRNKEIIDEIAHSIKKIDDIKLIDIDSGYSANRTVMTFVGNPQCILKAAFSAIKTAAHLINMQNHQGIHPRLGATDVCPLIPIRNVSMQDCIQLSHELGRRVGELGIPVYLYEASAQYATRRNLAAIRKGEYEGLMEKVANPAWQPDYGPVVFNQKSGVTVIGARRLLIAFNVNLKSKNVQIAQNIAATMRESGGIIMKDNQRIRVPGLLKSCKAIGWYVKEYDRVQVSTNLVNYRETFMHDVYEVIKKEAIGYQVEVTGSEIVGMVPIEAVLKTGEYYAQSEDPNLLTEKAKIECAIKSLGLLDVKPFVPEDKILEYQIEKYFSDER